MTAIMVSDHGGNFGEIKTTFASLEDAMAQATHDAKHGFGMPVRIVDANGKPLKTKEQIAKAAAAL